MGVSAIQIAKAIGATVIAVASTAEKRDVCLRSGADFAISYETMKEEIQKITNGKLVDVIYENVGGDVFNNCVKCIAPKGRLLVVGFASGEIPNFPVNLALVKGFSVVGVRSGAEMAASPSMTKEMIMVLLHWANQGKLQPRVTVVPFSRAKEALLSVANRTITGKSVILFSASHL